MHQQIVQPTGRLGSHHRCGHCALTDDFRTALENAHSAQALPTQIGVGVHIVVVDVLGNVGEQFAADLIGLTIKNDEVDRHVVVQQELADGVHRHAQRLILGIAEDTGGDQRESHRLAVVRLGQRKARSITGDKLLPLAAAAAVPHGADGVDHIPAGQAIGLGDLGIAGLAAAQRPALGQQLRSRRAVDAASPSGAKSR